jgi:hypothetical protein
MPRAGGLHHASPRCAGGVLAISRQVSLRGAFPAPDPRIARSARWACTPSAFVPGCQLVSMARVIAEPAGRSAQSADAGAGSICAVAAENNAERVAGGVGEDPEELGKSARVGAVDHCLLKAPDHTGIISASWSRPLPLGQKSASCVRAGYRSADRYPVTATPPPRRASGRRSSTPGCQTRDAQPSAAGIGVPESGRRHSLCLDALGLPGPTPARPRPAVSATVRTGQGLESPSADHEAIAVGRWRVILKLLRSADASRCAGAVRRVGPARTRRRWPQPTAAVRPGRAARCRRIPWLPRPPAAGLLRRRPAG